MRPDANANADADADANHSKTMSTPLKGVDIISPVFMAVCKLIILYYPIVFNDHFVSNVKIMHIIGHSPLRLNAAIVDTHRCARVLTGAKQCYFTTGKSPLFVLFIFVCSIMHVISK